MFVPDRAAGAGALYAEAYDEWTKLLPKGEPDHPARVYLIDQQGNIREIYSLAFFNEKQALIDMKVLLSSGAQGLNRAAWGRR